MEIRQFMDCFLSMPVVGKLEESCWGARGVIPRDQDNGLEDKVLEDPALTGKVNYTYWDGTILRDEDGCGKYHLFASRWNEADGFEKVNGEGGWSGSLAVEAVSDCLYGPYNQRERVLWPDSQGGLGHNVYVFRLREDDPAGKYAAIVSDTWPGDIFTTDSLDEGRWVYRGPVKLDRGYFFRANICIILRPDGAYELLNRDGLIALCRGSILDTFQLEQENLWPQVEGLPTVNMEDPVLWYSGGLYHCVVNQWSTRKAFYIISENGLDGWKLADGIAYSPTVDFLRYENSDVVNRWDKIERPGIYMEDGIVKAMTFAVLDLPKEEDKGNDGHASKVIVVPFDGEALNRFAREQYYGKQTEL
ncbi:hypothetical protein H9X90_11365 [Faecalicatena contorta]|uniref:hypothetical protein n=1 Tax=Faecalicatena contorta TaxID=39482 RepID=UPI00195F9B53|nr:hypothetical protein [Faecalicatena contorta]MBM6685862.1 hypothetical protein [Faecalicatena contorta]MBM6711334.1 hypothetical protein [Faecalicatena contorta]